jgi:insulysin
MILIPKNENRIFKYGILPNNLKYTIIYDKNSDTSNVVMNVRTGTLYEPTEFMGLAHFLEHMLFMGSDKYKDEDYYFKKLKEYGGTSNAFTDDDQTVYYFTVLSNNLEEILDIFSRFFIDPLFNINSVSREINAVNSEHLKNFNNDGWILRQLILNLSKKDHIINRFGTGSHKTLGSDIKKLRNTMIEFYNKYYCSNNMCLTVQSSRPINEIEKMIKACFSDIKPKKVIHPIIPILKYDSYNNEYHLKTVDDVNIINYIWELPEWYEYKDSGIINILTYIITFNCKNNLQNYLIENDYIYNIDISYLNIGLLLLSINILPNKSKDVYYKINSIVKNYFNNLNKFNWDLIYDYNIKLFELNYNNTLKENNLDLALKLSYNMHYYDEKNIYSASRLVIKKDYNKLIKTLEYLTFDKVNIIYASQNNLCSKYKKDKFYNKDYCKLSNSFITNDNNLKKFTISLEPSLLNIKPKNIKNLDKYNVPKKIAPKFWYTGVSKFKEPWVFGEICIQSHKFFNSIKSLALTIISINTINYYLQLLFCNEISVGYSISLSINNRTSDILVSLGGFNINYVEFFNKVVENMINIEPSDKIIKSNILGYKKNLENMDKNSPWEMSLDILATKINKYIYNYKDELKEMKYITIDMVKKRINKLINIKKLPITTIIIGNIEHKELKKCITYNINHKIDKIPTQKIPSSITLKHPNKDEKNICISYIYYIDNKNMDLLLNTKLLILNNIMERPAFDILRTKMQLGYLVRCNLKLDDVSYIKIAVMSPLEPIKVEEAMDEFINIHMNKILEEMDNKTFNKIKKSIYEKLTEKFNSLLEINNFHVSEIVSQDFIFDRNIRMAKKIKNITLNDILKLYHSIIKNKTIIKII